MTAYSLNSFPNTCTGKGKTVAAPPMESYNKDLGWMIVVK